MNEMNEEKETLESQSIDQVIEGGIVSAHNPQMTHLIQRLHTYSQEYKQANERSLDRIWIRLAQGQEHPSSLPARGNPSEEKILLLKEKKAMQNTPISGVMNSLPSSFPPKKRRSLMRVVGLSLIAAMVIIAVISFTLFSGLLRSTTSTAGKGSKTIIGALSSQKTSIGVSSTQQITISHGTLVCSFSAGPEVMLTNWPWKSDIAWSSQGDIAVTNYASVTASSAKDCASTTLSQTSIQRTFGAIWSPDGNKLLVGDVGNNTLYVLNRQGNIMAHLSKASVAAGMASVWSSDSTKIIFAAQDLHQQLNLLQRMDLSKGNTITTLVTFPAYSNIGQLSPDGKLALVGLGKAASKSFSPSIWDVASGKKISDLPSTLSEQRVTFSPNGSLFAVRMPKEIQIYTINGHLLSSIADTVSANLMQTLIWSPNGKYLAESSDAIKIYDIAEKKLVTTFGAVDAQHQIVSLTWAPNTTGIASTTIVVADGVPNDNMVNVWKLR